MNNYNGNAGNVSLASQVQISVPQDGVDPKAVSTVNTPMQKEADYLEAIRQIVFGSGFPINEGFESATFPPATPGWTSPSARFPSDSAWLRTTTGPLTGSASASAPTPQTASTNSSMGLQTYFSCPSRAQFFFAVTCNANNGDHLDFYVDGTLTAQFSSTSGPSAVAGTFYTDMLTQGLHTFDWRFVRGGSVSVGSEKCLIDAVQVIPEESWRTDQTLSRIYVFDDMGMGLNTTDLTALSPAAGGSAFGNWIMGTGTNVGSVVIGPPSATPGDALGLILLKTAATAAGDTITMGLFRPGSGSNFANFTLAKSMLAEWRVSPSVAWTANMVAEIGFISAGSDFCGWSLDGSVSTTNWRWRTRTSGGVQTDVDSGIAAAGSGTSWYRLSAIPSTVGGISSVVFIKDGKALPGAGSIPPLLVTNLPTSVVPGVQLKSVTAAASPQLQVDWARVLGLR